MTETKTRKGGARAGAGRPRQHDRPMRNTYLYLPVDLIDRLDQEAANTGVSRSAAATTIMEVALVT